MIKKSLTSFAVVAAVAGTVWAADLTLTGAEKAGNTDGSIPAWEGKDVPASGWSYGKYRGDYWKHKGEKSKFSIDAANVDKYKDKLSPGQLQFVKQTKGYRMDVFPTHRNAEFPDFVASNTRKNEGAAKLNANGALKTAYLPGIPFPKPKSGAEMMQNYLVRYRGIGIDMPGTFTMTSPRPGSTEWIEPKGPQHLYYPWAKKGGSVTPEQIGDLWYNVFFQYQSPPALAGQGIVISWNFNKDNEAHYYFPGQRRVRRLPSANYDTPQIGFENQYTFDQPELFNGSLDRFDWKIVGKKEMYVPYNNFAMYDFRQKLHDVIQNKFIKNESRRYELHRVWVVEGTVKKGVRHTAPKKVFYFDEDTFLILAGEDYDAKGSLWKYREAYSIPIWELGGIYDHLPFVQYDLISGRYVYDQGCIGVGKDFHWLAETNDSRFKPGYFTADNLRAVSDR